MAKKISKLLHIAAMLLLICFLLAIGYDLYSTRFYCTFAPFHHQVFLHGLRLLIPSILCVSAARLLRDR